MSLIHEKMLQIQKEIGRVGIAKDQRNEQQKFNYRGIDQLLNTIAPILSKAGVYVQPRMVDVSTDISPSGKQRISTVHMVYTFIAVEDASKVEIEVFGEGADMTDKGVAKAMTSAYKYMMIQAFAIPIVGNDDPDAQAEPEQEEVAAVITESEADALRDKVATIESETLSELSFCNWLCGVDSFDKVPAAQLARAGNALAAIENKSRNGSES